MPVLAVSNLSYGKMIEFFYGMQETAFSNSSVPRTPHVPIQLQTGADQGYLIINLCLLLQFHLKVVLVAPAEGMFLGAESGYKLWLMCLLCSTLPQELRARISVEYLEI